LDTTGISSLASSTASMMTGDAVGVSVLKKAMDLQKVNAMALLKALPPVRNLPAHLGQHIDTTA
jgi:hypothetical protein